MFALLTLTLTTVATSVLLPLVSVVTILLLPFSRRVEQTAILTVYGSYLFTILVLGGAL